MGTKYSSQAASGYNASPPSDDGSQTEANKVKWATIKVKLADVLKTFIEAVNTALVTALDQSCRSVSADENLAATDHNRTIQVTSASVTITLADAATMAAGYIVSVANQSSGDITVDLASATDTIDGVTNTTHTISAKEVRRYIVNTAATGYITASDRMVAATQAEMESASSLNRFVPPGRQQYHPGMLKGWVKADAAGNIAVSHNVTSITDVNPGIITVTWATDFSGTDYVAGAMPESAFGSNSGETQVSSATAPTAGTTTFICENSAGADQDPVNWHIWAMGDQ